jgi:hypothetical protein
MQGVESRLESHSKQAAGGFGGCKEDKMGFEMVVRKVGDCIIEIQESEEIAG